jgi:hypothetical protein
MAGTRNQPQPAAESKITEAELDQGRATLLKVYEQHIRQLDPAEQAAIVDARRILGDLADEIGGDPG